MKVLTFNALLVILVVAAELVSRVFREHIKQRLVVMIALYANLENIHQTVV